MIRNVAELSSREFDLLVVGGGIYGAWTAYHGAHCGLSVALIDAGDWAGATSSASSKLIHGGLRYLEQFRFGMVRKSLAEKRALLRLAPHRVRPLDFLVPLPPDARVHPGKLGLGLWIYDFLEGRTRFPSQIVVSPDEVRRRFPRLDVEGIERCFLYEDAQTDDALFTIEIVNGAVEAGAVAANRVRLIDADADPGRTADAKPAGPLRSFQCEDLATGKTVAIRSRAVVDTRGPWVEANRPLRHVKGVHLVLPPLETEDALLLLSRSDRRVIFILPWYGRTLVGTTDHDYEGDLRNIEVSEDEVDYLLRECAFVLGSQTWSRSDVISSFAGVRTLLGEDVGEPSDASREWELLSISPGSWASVGGKFTSARVDALSIVRRIGTALGHPAPARREHERPFPWAPGSGDTDRMETRMAALRSVGFDEESSRQLAERYGTRSAKLVELARADARLTERIVSDLPFVLAEAAFSVRETMAQTPEDILRRRTPVSLLSRQPVSPALEDTLNRYRLPAEDT